MTVDDRVKLNEKRFPKSKTHLRGLTGTVEEVEYPGQSFERVKIRWDGRKRTMWFWHYEVMGV